MCVSEGSGTVVRPGAIHDRKWPGTSPQDAAPAARVQCPTNKGLKLEAFRCGGNGVAARGRGRHGHGASRAGNTEPSGRMRRIRLRRVRTGPGRGDFKLLSEPGLVDSDRAQSKVTGLVSLTAIGLAGSTGDPQYAGLCLAAAGLARG